MSHRQVNKIKFLGYSLIVLSIIRVGVMYLSKDLPESVNTLELKWKKMGRKVKTVSTFNDSIIYNANYRLRVLDTLQEGTTLKDILASNKVIRDKLQQEIEELRKRRNSLSKQNNIYQGIDLLIDLLSVIAFLGIAVAWISSRKK